MANVFKSGNWLSELSAAAQLAIRQHVVIRRFRRGEHVYRQGAGASGLYQVISGHVQLRAFGASGEEMLVTIYGPGNVFGEVPLISTIKRPFDAVVVNAAEIAELPRHAFEQVVQEYPEIYRQLTEMLCHNIVALLMHIEDTSLLTLPQRLAKLLRSAARAYGRHHGSGVLIDLPLTQTDMSKLLGVSRQTIHRELAKWKERGLIDRQGTHWLIPRLEDLEQFVS